MPRMRLDTHMVDTGLVPTRAQAVSWIKLSKVTVNGVVASKAGQAVSSADKVVLLTSEQYVSRAGLKLASVAEALVLDFADKTVLDVGSSTGGFTDYALQHGAAKVYAVDVGTEQLHLSLRADERIELHEKTDIRDFTPDKVPDIVLIDVSFISLREILPHIAQISGSNTVIVAMLKPQFEAGKHQTNKGVIKNSSVRRAILRDFEAWVKGFYTVVHKADSHVAGAKGNQERFYLLKVLT